MHFSENQLLDIAKSNPKKLIQILNSPNVDVKTLTSGAELLGDEVTDETLVLPTLRNLLNHVHANVREGACIGLSSFFMSKVPPQDIIEKIKSIAEHDPSSILKDFAQSLLKDFQK